MWPATEKSIYNSLKHSTIPYGIKLELSTQLNCRAPPAGNKTVIGKLMIISFLHLFWRKILPKRDKYSPIRLGKENCKDKCHMATFAVLLPSPSSGSPFARTSSRKPSEGWAASRLHSLRSRDGDIVEIFSWRVGSNVQGQTVGRHLIVSPRKGKTLTFIIMF